MPEDGRSSREVLEASTGRGKKGAREQGGSERVEWMVCVIYRDKFCGVTSCRVVDDLICCWVTGSQ